MGATAKGFADAMDDPAAATDALMTAAPESDRELVSRSAEYLAPRYASSPESWGRQDAAVWSTFATWLHDQQILEEPLDTSAAFTNDFLPTSR